ncbi:replication initiator protein A [Anaerostipes hadrus]|uniref:DUF6017 domain-containing protein n=1 Tax=Anaerostipes hadrus TaxID=649756 RepID=UPI001D025CA9|nr:DUF6017 domain-containing protein [Anaerostipes hadrus]MCB5543700.1 replication initiator protein A [Anaerostipes hadrus]
MEKKMTFDYFYGTEADLFSFYRIPKALFTDSYFKDLSSDAKILYGLMLDRMSLSIKNQWFDDKNRAYIYFSIEDIMELLNCGRNKAIKSMRELDDETGIGLIEKRRQGFGKVNLIVETVMCKNDKILIASNWYPASLVKKKFLMLTYSHIEYVLHCMSGNTTKVKNIKKYLLAALFNAPSTMNGYYQAEVNHDMPGLVR